MAQGLGVQRSYQEVLATGRDFAERAGLEVKQVAANGYGFPFIPKPEPRYSEDGTRVRLAPRNISASFLGHPIFWIDPKLTERRDGETTQRWCIRMFFLIQAFGMWGEEDGNYYWVDFLSERGFDSLMFSETRSPVITYHSPTVQMCFADEPEYALMNESDLHVPLEEAEANVSSIVDVIESAEEGWASSEAERTTRAIELIADAIGGPWEQVSRPADPRGLWARTYDEPISRLLEEYREGAKDFSSGLGEVEGELAGIASAARMTLVGLNSAAATVTIPSLRSSGLSRLEVANLISFLRSENMALLADERFDFHKPLTEAFAASSYRQVYGVFRDLYAEYQSAWERGRLAIANYMLSPEMLTTYRMLQERYDEVEAPVIAGELRGVAEAHQRQSLQSAGAADAAVAGAWEDVFTPGEDVSEAPALAAEDDWMDSDSGNGSITGGDPLGEDDWLDDGSLGFDVDDILGED